MYCECCSDPPSTNFCVVPVARNANPLMPYSTIAPFLPTSFIVDHVTTISFTFSTNKWKNEIRANSAHFISIYLRMQCESAAVGNEAHFLFADRSMHLLCITNESRSIPYAWFGLWAFFCALLWDNRLTLLIKILCNRTAGENGSDNAQINCNNHFIVLNSVCGRLIVHAGIVLLVDLFDIVERNGVD